jgi:hypothetical protein
VLLLHPLPLSPPPPSPPPPRQRTYSPAMLTGRFMARPARPMEVAKVKGTANQHRPPNR